MKRRSPSPELLRDVLAPIGNNYDDILIDCGDLYSFSPFIEEMALTADSNFIMTLFAGQKDIEKAFRTFLEARPMAFQTERLRAVVFAAYEEDIDVNSNLDGFIYDPERDVYYRELEMMLRPITYIYLTQVILHNNKGRIAAIDGSSNLSGMARTTTLNTGQAGGDAVSVYYGVRMKRNAPLVPYSLTGGEKAGSEEAAEAIEKAERVDIVGGRLMTFGICGQKANAISRASEVTDKNRHFIDVNMQFNNGVDSLFAFDVTDQVCRRYKGGVITVELDLDTVPIPTRRGGSGFDAVVLEPDTVTHIIEM